jgi:hypothetical protein
LCPPRKAALIDQGDEIAKLAKRGLHDAPIFQRNRSGGKRKDEAAQQTCGAHRSQRGNARL